MSPSAKGRCSKGTVHRGWLRWGMGTGVGELGPPPHSEFRSRTSRRDKNFQASRERTLPCVRLGKREVGTDLPSQARIPLVQPTGRWTPQYSPTAQSCPLVFLDGTGRVCVRGACLVLCVWAGWGLGGSQAWQAPSCSPFSSLQPSLCPPVPPPSLGHSG